MLTIVLITQLWAMVITLLAVADGGGFIANLGSVSFYSQWLSLSLALILCALRDKLNRQTDGVAIVLVMTICLSVFSLVEILSQGVQQGFVDFSVNWSRFATYFAIALIFTLLLTRLFSLVALLEQRNKAEAESRMQALQSRIRPHFLFNSLNTISELVATEPEKAEQAIESLSQLFRASLETENRFHSLENELNLCRRYLQLETWRHGARLSVNWQIKVASPAQITLPRLLLQPLLENAVVHGTGDDGLIRIQVDVRETRADLSIMVENSKGQKVSAHEGHGIAMDNIRERLFVLYDDRQTFRVKDQVDNFSVLMRFPKDLHLQTSNMKAGG